MSVAPARSASIEEQEMWVADEFRPHKGAFGQEPFTLEYCLQRGLEYPTGRTPIKGLPTQYLIEATEFLRDRFAEIDAVRTAYICDLAIETTRSFHNRPDKLQIAKALIEFGSGKWWESTDPKWIASRIGWGN